MIKHEQAPQASKELIHDLSTALADVKFDWMTRLLYSTDASIYQVLPIGVGFPRNADEAAAAVEIATKHGVPVLPRGGGSSLAGQTVNQALVLDFTRYMDQIIEINPETQTVRVQPGIALDNLNRALLKQGFMFGPDPASSDRATIGGIIGNNSTGSHSIVYGMTVDHAVAMDVILSDGSRTRFDALNGDTWEERGKRPGLEGTIYRAMPAILDKYRKLVEERYPGTWRHVAGYNLNQLIKDKSPNLAKLIVGSEGTLVTITEATLGIVRPPKMKRLTLVHFSDLRPSLEAVPVILESDPAAVELIEKFMLDLTRDKLEYRRLLTFIEGDPRVVLIVEHTGDTEAELDAKAEQLQKLLKRINHHDPVVVVSDPKQQANVWYVRKVGLGLMMSIRGDAKPFNFIEDAAVPVEHLADYVIKVIEACHEVGCDLVPMYAHASAGCIHIQPMIDLKTADGVRQLRQIAEASASLAISYGGTTSGEHGDGIVRAEFLEKLYGPEIIEAFHEVKAIFDPHNLMNPHRILDTPRLDDETILRFGTDYRTPLEPSSTILSFESDGGFARAVEMCNGQGVCRKIGTGVMCPSYLATRDEAHSTRGRANALRSAMMGLLGPEGMTSKELYEIFDLCLSCKACKSECPSAVDMAKIKAEFVYHYYQKHGVPLRSRLFANIAALNALAQPFAPISNVMLAGPVKWIMTGLGVHEKRTLPKLASQTFTGWYRQHLRSINGNRPKTGKQVVFFHDTFMQHNSPEIGQAAIQVLEAAGYDIIIPWNRKCCGRPAISKGLLDEAAKLARHNVKVLAPFAQQGIPIVGCEPSCMAALVDEYPSLVPGPEAKAVAEMATTIDVFLAREAEAGQLNLHFDETPRKILLHGQCIQKAIFGTASTHAMLKLIPNCTVEEVNSSCCGMAGSFGYEAEHYDLSMKLAEMSLAPAVRAASPDTLIAAPGTSCREQIHHTTERGALHPIQILAAALKAE
jgi:FAD/FMN-containing dehydrogenase/Fe-S oxidoreductase